MEFEVKLNPAGVRKLRESKSWTQEHLANAAGVSLRTIQRMEALLERMAPIIAKYRLTERVKDKVPT